MNINVLVIASLFFLIPGCSNDQSQQINLKTSTLLVQAHFDSLIISSLINELTPIINGIIKKELKLTPKYNFDFFIPKKLQRITLYYVNDSIMKDASNLLSTIENMPLMKKNLKHIAATSEVEFFGDQKDELVMMINDSDKELFELNRSIKTITHQANDKYIKKHYRALYNIEKSERFPFLPHMGLGRIRTQSIKNNIKDKSQTEFIFDRIRDSVKTITHNILEKAFLKKNLSLPFSNFAILDLKKQIYIKEW